MTAFLTDKRWRLVLAIAALTALSGLLLVGVSAWFLSAVAIAGLTPAAFAFNYHVPAALVRLLALTRTGGKYAERCAGHNAALDDQRRHRADLFRRMAKSDVPRRAGWQLARTDELHSFLDDVETVDFIRLRSDLPTLTAVLMAAVVLAVGAFILPVALPVMLGLLGAVWLAGQAAAKGAGSRANEVSAMNRRAGELLGQQFGGLVSLDAEGRRTAALGATLAISRKADRLGRRGALVAATSEALLSAGGLLGAGAIVALGFASNANGLLVAGLGFGWLALWEVLGRVPKARAAKREASAAAVRLAGYGDATSGNAEAISPASLAVRAPLVSPVGDAPGGKVDFQAERGVPTALYGPSGCGKTSLLKALAGWIDWPGADHPFGDAQTARASCHLSLHDAAILKASVRANLLSDRSDAEMWAALDAVELSQRVREAGGLDGLIGPEVFSLGEARRIALARAFLSTDPVILLDEPGEHLGAAQGQRILHRLLQAMADRIVIYVTHEKALADLASACVKIKTD